MKEDTQSVVFIATEEMLNNCPFSVQNCDECNTQACTKSNPEAYITSSWICPIMDEKMWA